MNKGQASDKSIKNILKAFKMNEDKFSTILGVVVVFLVGMMMYNYFKSAKLNMWKGNISESGLSTTLADAENNSQEKKLDTYKVVKGDNLWRISEKYYKSGYNYVDIIKENKLSAKGQIEVGMELRLPKVESKKITVREAVPDKKDELKAAAKVEPTLVKTAGTIDLDTYTTQKGDSLWTIAVRAYGDGFKWTKIYWSNREVIGKDPNVLFVGVKLSLPKNI